MPIRRAAPEDAGEVARLAAELGYPDTVAAVAGRLLAALADPAQQVLVAAEVAGRLDGWIHAQERQTLESRCHVEIVGLVVDACRRGQGLGGDLLAALEHWARERGQSRITVRSNVARTGSHPFYLAHGFRRVKTQHVYLRELSA